MRPAMWPTTQNIRDDFPWIFLIIIFILFPLWGEEEFIKIVFFLIDFKPEARKKSYAFF